jgi:FkbM family methyltransferase
MATLNHLLPEFAKQRLKARLGAPTLEISLMRMKQSGFNSQIVIDVGAYTGEWTTTFKSIFPTAKVLMFEPQKSKQSKLSALADSDPGISFQSKLLGASSLERVKFYESETTSSVLTETTKSEQAATWLSMTTLDEATQNTEFAHPDFLKLDVQGYELEVLKGGTQALAAAQAVLMEVNLLEVIEGAPLFHETVAFMAARDFRVYDICSFIRRPCDAALWQMDVVFVKESSPLLAYKGWD